MPRKVSPQELHRAVQLIISNEHSQREICKITGLSRPYIRKLCNRIGIQFPRNGIEILGELCMCLNCSGLFRRPPSKVKRAEKVFCSEICKYAYSKGANHPSWGEGKAKTFSQWIMSQSQYKHWREAVLERDGHTCQISGRTDNLEAHHVNPKVETESPDKVFDVNNGITLNKEIHTEIHKLIREGKGFNEAIEYLKNKYQINAETTKE